MILTDGSLKGEPDRFELKNGEFGQGEGDKRSAASEITSDYIQFVPAVPGKMNRFRFERQSNGTWRAVLMARNSRQAGPPEDLYHGALEAVERAGCSRSSRIAKISVTCRW
jgi:hypothetical protein